MKRLLRWTLWPFIVLLAIARWAGGTFLVASLALFPVALVAELVFRKHHVWKEHLIAAAVVALGIGAVVAAGAWLGRDYLPRRLR